MIEKLSSLWLRFMPTLVSPATSIFRDPPTFHLVERSAWLCAAGLESLQPEGPGVNRVSPASTLDEARPSLRRDATGFPQVDESFRRNAHQGALRSRAECDDHLSEPAVESEDKELDLVADRMFGDDVGQLFGCVDGRAVDCNDEVRLVAVVAAFEAPLLGRAAGGHGHDPDAVRRPRDVRRADDAEPGRRRHGSRRRVRQKVTNRGYRGR